MRKKTAKIILIVVLSLFGLATSLPIVMQTRPFKNRLATFIEKTVNKQLNAELSIGRIHGNFFTHIALSDTYLMFKQDTLAALPSVTLHYAPRALLKKKIAVSSFIIDSPRFSLYQFPDSSWVFEHIVRPREKVEKDSTDTSFDWEIELHQFEIINLNADIAAIDSFIPKKITDLNISVAGFYGTDHKKLNLKNLAFATHEPDIQLVQLTFDLEQDKEGATLNNFKIQTGKNTITAQANSGTGKLLEADAELTTEPIDFSEFQFIAPSLKIKGQPRITLKSKVEKDELEATLQISSAQSLIDLRATINRFSYLLGDSTAAEPGYKLDGSWANIMLSDWAPHLKQAIRLNGDISINGSGISSKSAETTATLHLYDCDVEQRKIKNLVLESAYTRGHVSARLSLTSDMGQLEGTTTIKDISSSQIFDVNLSCRNLNLASVLLDTSMTSDINVDVQASGHSFSRAELTGDIVLAVQPSTIYDINIDTLYADAHIAEQSVTINTLHAKNAAIDMNAAGTLGLNSASDFTVNIKSKNLTALNHIIKADTIAGAVHINAAISGVLDSLVLAGTIKAGSLLYNGYTVDSLLLDIKGRKTGDDLFSTAQAHIRSIDLGRVIIEELAIEADLTPERVDVKTSLRQGENIRANVHLQYLLNELPIIYIKQLDVDLLNRQWRGGGDETSIMFGDGEYIVTDFLIQHKSEDSTNAQIYIDGAVRFHGDEDFQLSVKNYKLAPLSNFMENHPILDGNFDLDIRLTGTAENPKLEVRTQLSNVQYNNFTVKQLNGMLTYTDETVKTHISLIPKADSLTINGYVPAHFSLADQSFHFNDNKPFDITIKSTHIPLKDIIPQNFFMDEISGLLKLDIHARNTLSNIIPNGTISIDNGSFKNEMLGIQLDDFDMNLLIKQDSLVLENFSAGQSNGDIQIDGFAALDSSIFSGILNAIQLNIKANDFYLSQKPEHEIQIDSDIEVKGYLDSLRFSGSLEILRSSFYLPALTKGKGNQEQTSDIPLLVQAISKLDTLSTDTTATSAVKKETPPILKNLRGTLNVKIPRNTWFKSDNMRVEISGDVDIIKNSETFELFGPIEILRGQYDFLARRFKLTEGTVSFQGGKTIDPMLNVQAEYAFRDSKRDKRTIHLVVTDQASTPDIQFLLDNDQITEGEAVSYILFNRSPEEMGGGSSGSPSQTGYIATDLVYGMMSAELSKRFGQQLGVDYIEIKGEGNLNTATFIVGKYITPDLFMSYEHSIGSLEEDRPPQVVTVEYELTKYIFLQLISGDTKSTGADIIFKFDK